FFPQFVWLSTGVTNLSRNQKLYHFSFLPLVIKESGFPFEIHLQGSLRQQFPHNKELVATACQLIAQRIQEKQLVQKGVASEESIENAIHFSEDRKKERSILSQKVASPTPITKKRTPSPFSSDEAPIDSAEIASKKSMIQKKEPAQT